MRRSDINNVHIFILHKHFVIIVCFQRFEFSGKYLGLFFITGGHGVHLRACCKLNCRAKFFCDAARADNAPAVVCCHITFVVSSKLFFLWLVLCAFFGS